MMTNLEHSILLKKELDALRPLKEEDRQRIFQKFRLDWNYHSNNLEGNSLTYGETKALILFGITAQGKPLKDHFEITGHDEAIKWVIDIVDKKRPLTENFIRELHKLILKESYFVDAISPEGKPTRKKIEVGIYKTSPNHVRTKTGEIFRFAMPEETPALMNDLISWYREKSNKKVVNPILLASEFHYKYIRIHPFDDGNGRTARILMNFILMQFGYPPVIIKTEDKENYFAALRQADADLFEPFVEYIAENLNRSLSIMIKGAKGESIEESDDIDKEIALLEQKLKSKTNPIKVWKSKEPIKNIYANSIVELATTFFEKARLFERFYENNNYSIYYDGNGVTNPNKEEITNGITNITASISSIRLTYSYQFSKQIEIKDLRFNMDITFHFLKSSYRILNGAKLPFEKLYSEQLNQEEIKELVNSELKRHKDYIEGKIEGLEKK